MGCAGRSGNLAGPNSLLFCKHWAPRRRLLWWRLPSGELCILYPRLCLSCHSILTRCDLVLYFAVVHGTVHAPNCFRNTIVHDVSHAANLASSFRLVVWALQVGVFLCIPFDGSCTRILHTASCGITLSVYSTPDPEVHFKRRQSLHSRADGYCG